MVKYLSVSELNKYIKNIIATDFVLNKVYVKGEVSGFKFSRGNFYFSLKDESSVINCIIFGSNYKPEFTIEDGMTLLVSGKVAVYEKNGSYSIYVYNVENQGLGQYYIKLEKLKKKLSDNGMFDEQNKKPIPKYGINIGVVTAKDGAAIRDIEITLKNRNPYVNIFLYPAKVQGEGAADTISRGIDVLDKMDLDVIIVGRGGGSIEDLYAFNDEKVAYSIFAAKTPIISAVGHEINNSIADMVADLRVATPTAAAEAGTFDYYEFIETLDEYKDSFTEILNDNINDLKDIIDDYKMKLSLLDPKTLLDNYENKFDGYKYRFRNNIKQYINNIELLYDNFNERVRLSYPFYKLDKGMAYINNDNKKAIKSINDIDIDNNINIELKDGKIKAKVFKKIKRKAM